MPEQPKRIHLVGQGRPEEATAAGTIKPGHLIKLDSSGNVIVHGTAGGPAEAAFALEDALQGNTIADAYSSGDKVFFVLAQKGDVIYAYLSGGESADPSEFLTSNGDGALKVASGTDIRIAVPLETVDASDSNDVDERIKVRII
jgi:hypothetical protein